MKRLLIAMAAVVGALGFFSAQASDSEQAADSALFTGTGFDDLSVGDLDTRTENNYWSSWSTGDASSEWLKVTNWDGSGKSYTGTRPAVPEQTEQKNYLDVKTSFTNGVERYINADGTVYTMTGDVFVDTLVKFTTADEELEVPDGTKLAIYLKEITGEDGDEIISTNLFVRAGTYGDDGVTLSPCSYDCGMFANPDDWHRLTVRAIKDAYDTSIGFVIFVDSTEVVRFGEGQSTGYKKDSLSNEAKAFENQHRLFPSLISGASQNGQKLTGIGLAGSGAIDDIVFQSETPADIAKDDYVTLKWDEHVTSVIYSVNGGEGTSVGDDVLRTGSCVIKYINGMTVAVTAEYEGGYAAGVWTNGTDVTLSGTTFTFAGFSVNDAWAQIVSKYVREDYSVTINDETVKYSLIDDVLAAINKDGVTSATITLLNDVMIGRTVEGEGQDSYVRTEARFENKGITIDLAGKTIYGPTVDAAEAGGADDSLLYVICVTGGSLTIKDSSNNASGKIVAKSAPGVVWVESAEGASAATLAISGGTFDGLVGFDADGDSAFGIEPVECSLTGGSYLASDNSTTTEGQDTAFSLADYVVKNYAAALDDNSTYWVVSESQEETTWKTLLGEPDESGAYLIDDAEDLLKFAQYVNGTDGVTALATADVTFKLTTDIALTVPEDRSASIAGIGIPNAKDLLGTDTYSTFTAGAFKGTFDGGNFTISNVILPRTDYAGLFMSAYGATIKNLKVSLGNATGFATAETKTAAETAANGDYGGGVIVGVSVNTTVESCETVVAGEYDTFRAPKALAGIVGYAGGATVIKDCVNNLAISSEENTKVAGIAAILQAGKGPAAENFDGATVEGCTNSGNVSTSATSSWAAGLVSYVDMALTIKGKCAQTGRVTGDSASAILSVNGGSVTVAAGAAITTAQVGQLAANKLIDGLTFATVDENGTTATFVKNDALTLGSTYKVMAAGATFTLAKENDTITFDTSLATVKVEMSSDVSTDDYKITETKDAANENVITYTLAKKASVQPVDPGVEEDCGTDQSKADSLVETINNDKATYVNVSKDLTDEQKTAYLDLIAAKVITTTSTEGSTTYSVVVDLTQKASETIQEQVNTKTKELEVSTIAATTSEAVSQELTKVTPGLYYSVVAGPTLGGMGVRSSTMATGDTLSVTLPHYDGAGFYRIEASVNVQPVKSE